MEREDEITLCNECGHAIGHEDHGPECQEQTNNEAVLV